ncbi:unnamed protein product, partial [Iphiclides podalirius]
MPLKNYAPSTTMPLKNYAPSTTMPLKNYAPSTTTPPQPIRPSPPRPINYHVSAAAPRNGSTYRLPAGRAGA